MIEVISTVGVLGAGLMGHGIAQLAAQAGCEVYLVDSVQEAVDKGYENIKSLLNRGVKAGKLSLETSVEIQNRIKFSVDLDTFQNCDLVIEAIPESMDLKKEVFLKLDKIVKQDAILAKFQNRLTLFRRSQELQQEGY